jgi:hypothetical protein
MPDYANGKIYKIEPICDHELGEIYFGSTTRRLCDRWGNHKSAFKSNNNCCSSVVLFSKYGIESCNILLVELVTASSKEELIAREAFYIRNNNCVNKRIPDRTQAEYGADYYAENKDKLTEYSANFRADNREKILKSKTQYNTDNKEKIAKKSADYRANNKEKISKQRAKLRAEKLLKSKA